MPMIDDPGKPEPNEMLIECFFVCFSHCFRFNINIWGVNESMRVHREGQLNEPTKAYLTSCRPSPDVRGQKN